MRNLCSLVRANKRKDYLFQAGFYKGSQPLQITNLNLYIMLNTVQSFVKNYGSLSYMAILSNDDKEDCSKTILKYYEIFADGTLNELKEYSKETVQLEKLARNFIKKQDYFFLWSY